MKNGSCPECRCTLFHEIIIDLTPLIGLQCTKCGWTWNPPTTEEVVDKIIEIGSKSMIGCPKCGNTNIGFNGCLECGHIWAGSELKEMSNRSEGETSGLPRSPSFEEVFGGPIMYDSSNAPEWGFSQQQWYDFTGDVESAYRLHKKSDDNHQDW